eukprot:scaffold2109_cov188-Amphora_coffeaeformis.AAC.6
MEASIATSQVSLQSAQTKYLSPIGTVIAIYRTIRRQLEAMLPRSYSGRERIDVLMLRTPTYMANRRYICDTRNYFSSRSILGVINRWWVLSAGSVRVWT